MQIDILVIDDEIATRRRGYDDLLARLNDSGLSGKVSFEYIRHPKEIISRVQAKRFVFAIVDVVLNGNREWGGYTLRDALSDVSDLPVVLVSGRWDAANMDWMEYGWKQKQFEAFLEWRHIDPGEQAAGAKETPADAKGAKFYGLRTLQRLIQNLTGTTNALDDAASRDLNILHISDIQFGGFDEANLSAITEQDAAEIKSNCGFRAPDFVVISGDITEHALPSEFDQAAKWLSAFLEKLDMTEADMQEKRLLVVPGNHDVSAYMSAAVRAGIRKIKGAKDGEPKFELATALLKSTAAGCQNELLGYAYEPFKKFHQSVCDRPFLKGSLNEGALAWIENRFRHVGVVFYGLNTAQPAMADGSPDRSACEDCLTDIRGALTATFENVPPLEQPVVIGVGHHCPVEKEKDRGVRNPDTFKEHLKASNPDTHLFLHGHWHTFEADDGKAGGKRLVRACAPTLKKGAGSRGEDTLRGYNLITLVRENGNITKLKTKTINRLVDENLQTNKKTFVRSAETGQFREDN